MKKLLVSFAMAFLIAPMAYAKETITLVSYLGPASSISVFYKAIVDQANVVQNKYQFELTYKPGAQGLLALQEMDQSTSNRLALISAGYVDLVEKGKIKKEDYIPINSGGSTCWVIMSPKGDISKGLASLKGEKSLTLSTVGLGTSTHLTSLMIGEKVGAEIKPVIFKTGIDGVMLMAADESIHLAVDRPDNYLTFRSKNPNIKALGTNCDVRNPKVPDVKTFKEQGFEGISVWSFAVANRAMPESKRIEVGKALDQAMISIGQQKIFEKFDLLIPILNGMTTQQHFEKSYNAVVEGRRRFAKHIVDTPPSQK